MGSLSTIASAKSDLQNRDLLCFLNINPDFHLLSPYYYVSTAWKLSSNHQRWQIASPTSESNLINAVLVHSFETMAEQPNISQILAALGEQPINFSKEERSPNWIGSSCTAS